MDFTGIMLQAATNTTQVRRQALIGIPLDMLIMLIVIPAAFVAGAWVFWYFVWVPKFAREICSAKLHRQDINLDTNDIGVSTARRGKVMGPGIFQDAKGKITEFLMRQNEGWINKLMSIDKIRIIYSYSGKAVCASAATLATLELNKQLNAEKLKFEADLGKAITDPVNEGKTEQQIFSDYIKSHPQAVELLSKLAEHRANIEAVTEEPIDEVDDKGNKKVKTKKTVERKVAILTEPRILMDYIDKTIGPEQVQYVIKKAYNQGFEEGKAPILQRMIPVILVFGIVAAMVLAAVSL